MVLGGAGDGITDSDYCTSKSEWTARGELTLIRDATGTD